MPRLRLAALLVLAASLVVAMAAAPAGALTSAEIAQQFRPLVRFDNSEDWRPLNLPSFFAERDPTTGAPYHKICDAGSCTGITSTADLALHHTSSSSLDIHGSGSEANYTSPDPTCISTSRPRRDCASGPSNGIYWHVVPTLSPGGYQYYDYWLWYRYDYVGSVVIVDDFNHEGDWENVTVGVKGTAPTTFDYVTFSQHGSHYAYLRQNLQCNGGGSGSCGTQSAKAGTRVWDYVANGTHANYATSCSELFFGWCTQADGITPERGHDGAKPWLANGDTTILLQMPEPTHTWATTGDGTWSDWPGVWGQSGGPASPGNQNPHFNQPWTSNSCWSSGCAMPAGVRAAQAGCGAWLGGDVAALACDPAQLRRSIAAGTLDGASVDLRRITRRASAARAGRRAAEAAPLAQLMGGPLRPGQGLLASSHRPLTTTIAAHVRSRRYGGIVVFGGVALRPGAGAHVTVSLRAGRPVARLHAGGRIVAPSQVHIGRLPR